MSEDQNKCYFGPSKLVVKSSRVDSKQVAKGHCSGEHRNQKTLSCPRHRSHIPSLYTQTQSWRGAGEKGESVKNQRDWASLEMLDISYRAV